MDCEYRRLNSSGSQVECDPKGEQQKSEVFSACGKSLSGACGMGAKVVDFPLILITSKACYLVNHVGGKFLFRLLLMEK